MSPLRPFVRVVRGRVQVFYRVPRAAGTRFFVFMDLRRERYKQFC